MALAEQADTTGHDIQDEITTALEGDQISAVREAVRPENYPVEIHGGAHLEAAAARHLGQVRPTQQDAFGVWSDLGLALVADGMGGRPAVIKANQRFLTQAIGLSPTVRVSLRVEPLHSGDIFLLCTDGLWNCVSHVDIAQTLTQATSHGATPETLATATQTLLDKANQAGGLDNITVVLVRPTDVSGV